MYIDARAIKTMPPGEHIVVEGCLGLRIEASATRRSWIYRYKSPVDGRMRQVKLGQWPAMSLATAVSRWQEIKARRDAGEDPGQKRRETVRAARRKVLTVADVVADYFTLHLNVNREAKGAKAVHARLTAATAALASSPAAELTRADAFDLVTRLSDKPVLARSVRSELAAAWDLALDAGRLPADTPNWWRQIQARRLRSRGAMRDGERKGSGKRVLSRVELARLLNVDLPKLPEQVRDVLTLYLWTVCRGAEIVQMHTDHISEEDSGTWWTMPKQKLKGERHGAQLDLRVPLVGRALEVVKRRRADRKGFLFPSESPGGHVKQASIQSQVHFRQPYSKARLGVARERLSVTHWSPHDLRRTSRTLLAAMKCPRDVGELILGHVLAGVEGDYNLYTFDAERRSWLTLLSAELEGIATGAEQDQAATR